jgi:TonB family protein
LVGNGYKVVVVVEVDDSGRVLKATVERGSSNASYDASAKSAALAVGTVPRPPDKYQDGQPNRYRITFTDPGG